MSSSISFAEFRAAAVDTDSIRDRALLFVYRAMEDFAAEMHAAPNQLTVLDISPDGRGFASAISRWGARARPIAPRDAATLRDDDRFDVVTLDRVLGASHDDELLTHVLPKLDSAGLVVAVVSNRRRGLSARRLERRLAGHGLAVHRLMNAAVVAPPLRALRTFDADFANVVPHWMASGWLVALRRRA